MIVLSFWIASLSELNRFFCKPKRWKIIWKKSFHFVLQHTRYASDFTDQLPFEFHSHLWFITLLQLRFFSMGWIVIAIAITTSKHSSRMRIAGLLTVSDVSRGGEGLCIPGGGLHPGGGCILVGVGGQTPPFPPVNRMTEGCKNITLPQTSFAGGKNGCTTLGT